MTVDRMLPSREAADLLDLTRQLADRELAPRVAEAEASETFPAEVFKILGAAGLLGLPYPESLGGGGQPYEVYLQVLEELAMRWAAVAVTVSVHGLSCFPAGHVRHPGAAGAVAARSARRGHARGVQPVRAAGGLGRGRAGLPGGPGRRRLRDHRHQGVDHRRRQRRLVHAVRPHGSRQPGGVLLPGAGRRAPDCRSARRSGRWGCGRCRRPVLTTTACGCPRTG